jgi:hypothetical protein
LTLPGDQRALFCVPNTGLSTFFQNISGFRAVPPTPTAFFVLSSGVGEQVFRSQLEAGVTSKAKARLFEEPASWNGSKFIRYQQIDVVIVGGSGFSLPLNML